MFSRTTPDRGAAPLAQDPLHLRIASAAVVLGLVAASCVMVSRAATARGGPVGADDAAAGRPAAANGALSGPPGTAGEWPARNGAARSGPARSLGLRLLGEAAAACQNLAYQGVQVAASMSPAGRRISVVDVWHKRDRQALIQIADTGSGAPQEQDPAPVLDMTPQMVVLLGANYEVTISGAGLADGRPAQVVVVRRADGEMAARFWLDNATKLPLRRQVFDTHARMVSDDVFIDLKLGADAAAGAPAAGARPPSRPLSQAALAKLRAQGWPLPGPLPAQLTEFEASQTVTASGAVVELAYSDGLSVVSLFVQRGHLPAELSGWSEVALRGQHVYAADPDDSSVAWSSDGFVYTLVADAPAQTVDQVIAALPHDASPGLVGRLVLGLRRLIRWADPFR
jgi:sigma-E factor negative regulatory protein RseB